MTASLRVEMLGGFQVVGGSARITRFRTRQTASLFAYLALNRGKAIAREILAEMFWPDAPDHEKARASLSVAISSLRGQLEKGQGGKILQVDARALGVFAEAVVSDVEEFERALAHVPQEDSPEAIRALEDALSLFRGTFLPGFYEDWVMSEQVRLRDRFIASVRRLGMYFEGDGNVDAAIYWRRQEVAHFPDDHDALAYLLRLLIEEARLQEAAAAFYTAQSHWPNKKKTPLSGDLLKQLEPILKDYPPQQARPRNVAPAPAVVNLPAVSAVPAHLPALPRELARFVGRGRELEVIRKFAQNPENRILTLIGLGGMGKTRLAVEAGHQLRQEGISTYFVGLQNARSERDLLREIALSLQIPLSAGADHELLEPIVYVLGVQERTVLILDNLEQLIGTSAGDCLVRLLNRVPELHCLATSQRRLSLPGERFLRIEPLAVPTEEALTLGRKDPEAFEAAWPCLALFVDRARESMPDFYLHPGNIELVTQIMVRLEGMPLALLLAAARIQVMSLLEILEGLSHTFSLASTRRQTSPERHRSLEASISWSYTLLRPELQRFFCQLTSFRGSFGSGDVAVVLKEALAMDYLSELCDSSFLTATVGERYVRFEILEPLRLFGGERLTGEERAALHLQHAQHFATVAAQSPDYWRTDRESEWLERLKRDLENLRAAMEWSLESDDDAHVGVACQLGVGLARFWWVSLLSPEGREFLTQLLGKESLASHLSLEQQVRLHNSLISQEIVSGNKDKARVQCTIALALVDKLDNPTLRGTILANLGIIEIKNLGWEENNPYLQEGIQIFETLNDYPRLITIYHNICLAHISGEYIHDMPRYIKKELSISTKYNNRFDISSSIQSFANYLFISGEFRKSEYLYKVLMSEYIENNSYYDVIGALLCFLVGLYVTNNDFNVLNKISFILEYRKKLNLEEGPFSRAIIERYNVKLPVVELPSPNLARQIILSWASEAIVGLEYSYDDIIQEILTVL